MPRAAPRGKSRRAPEWVTRGRRSAQECLGFGMVAHSTRARDRVESFSLMLNPWEKSAKQSERIRKTNPFRLALAFPMWHNQSASSWQDVNGKGGL